MTSTSFPSKAEQFAKDAENHPSIFGRLNLTSLRESISQILKLIGRGGIFHEYTLHDVSHIDAMLTLVDRIIPSDTAVKMRTADWLMIVLGCYFHDLGMLVTEKEFAGRDNGTDFLAFKAEIAKNKKDTDYLSFLGSLSPEENERFLYQEFVRTNHAKRIYHWIKGEDPIRFGKAGTAVQAVNDLLAGLEQVFRDDLAKVCLSHHEDDLFDLDKYRINRVYGENAIGEANLHYASLVLRTVDVLHIQRQRVPTVLYKLIDPSNPKSQEEWAKQNGVRAVIPRYPDGSTSGNTIEIHAAFDDEGAYFGLLAYVQQYAAREVKRCHDWAQLAKKRGSVFEYPWITIDTSQVEPRGFEGREYSFRLDQDKILKLLTGHTLYNDYRIAIRELLQNSLDAVRFRKHQYPDEPIGKIEVEWQPSQRQLVVRDSGTGMTQLMIEGFLLNVGSSYYQSEEVIKKYADFSPISRFGIGVLSTFMIADEVKILTVHPDEEDARQLTLPSVVKTYLIKRVGKNSPEVRKIGAHGTEVTLKVRRSARLNDVAGIVRFWLVIPGCDVTCKTGDSSPVSIGFMSAKEVLTSYYQLAKDSNPWKVQVDVRTFSEPGIELAYIVHKTLLSDVWDLTIMSEESRDDDEDEYGSKNEFSAVPGMCVEGVRVRSSPAGYESPRRAPWVFANLTGRDAPKTNVARSDLEQTPELESCLFGIYSMLGRHIQHEFDRLVEGGNGVSEAASETEFIREWGLDLGRKSNPPKFREALSKLKVVALEDGKALRAVSRDELVGLGDVWTCDSRLSDYIDGIAGTLGLDITSEELVQKLGKRIDPPIPLPRLLGSSIYPLMEHEIAEIRIYPEERTHRIDVRWSPSKIGRWLEIPPRFMRFGLRTPYETILIAKDPSIRVACEQYDVVVWRQNCLILSPAVLELSNVLGSTPRLGKWIALLLDSGILSADNKTLLQQQLTALGVSGPGELVAALRLPIDRRFGDPRARRNQFADPDEF